jgi:hypothetical protein
LPGRRQSILLLATIDHDLPAAEKDLRHAHERTGGVCAQPACRISIVDARGGARSGKSVEREVGLTHALMPS